MNNLRVGLMGRRNGCLVNSGVIRSFDRKICVCWPMLTDDSNKSELFAKIKSIFGCSSACFNAGKLQPVPKYIALFIRGVGDHGTRNRKSSTRDSSGQKLDENNSPEKKEKKPSVKVDWSVKLDEKIESEESVEEHVPKYVLRQKWGVNLLEPMRLEQRRATNKCVISRFDDVMQSDKNSSKASPKIEMKVLNESFSIPIDSTSVSSILPTTSEQDESLKLLQEQDLKHRMNKNSNIDNSKTFSSNINSNSSKYDEEYNTSREIDREDEIVAWKNVIVRTREHIEKMAEAGKVQTSEVEVDEPEIKFSILPEPPRPKLDIAAVKTTELYHLIDSYMDPSEPPTAKGIRIALHQVNSKKILNTQKSKQSFHLDQK